MDPHRIDTLARALGTTSTRRMVVGGLLSSLSLPFLPARAGAGKRRRQRETRDAGPGSVAAEKKHKKRKKHKTSVPPPAPACVPACGSKVCGADGCGGTCGACPGSQVCQNGGCGAICTPDCSGRNCGDDGCGGTCGECAGVNVCRNGTCASSSAGTCTQGHDYCLGDPGGNAPSRTCGSGHCTCHVRIIEPSPFCGTGMLCGCPSDAYCEEHAGPGSVCVVCTHCVGETVNTGCVSPCSVQ